MLLLLFSTLHPTGRTSKEECSLRDGGLCGEGGGSSRVGREGGDGGGAVLVLLAGLAAVGRGDVEDGGHAGGLERDELGRGEDVGGGVEPGGGADGRGRGAGRGREEVLVEDGARAGLALDGDGDGLDGAADGERVEARGLAAEDVADGLGRHADGAVVRAARDAADGERERRDRVHLVRVRDGAARREVEHARARVVERLERVRVPAVDRDAREHAAERARVAQDERAVALAVDAEREHHPAVLQEPRDKALRAVRRARAARLARRRAAPRAHVPQPHARVLARRHHQRPVLPVPLGTLHRIRVRFCTQCKCGRRCCCCS